jgi:hypothetical protein
MVLALMPLIAGCLVLIGKHETQIEFTAPPITAK